MSEPNSHKNATNSTSNRISLTQMRAGQKGKIVGTSGGDGLTRKLEALGIRECEEIKKMSEQWMRGPVLLQHRNTQLALGFGMAAKVFVETTGKDQ